MNENNEENDEFEYLFRSYLKLLDLQNLMMKKLPNFQI